MTFEFMVRVFTLSVSAGIVMKFTVDLLLFAVDSLMGFLRNILFK